MKYYELNGKIQAFFTEGAVEIMSPVRADGTLLPQHTNIDTVITDENNNYYEFYLATGEPDVDKIAEIANQNNKIELKKAKLEAVDNIIVQIDVIESGNLVSKSFQGDETSQTRMTRAVSVMSDTDKITWVLENNTYMNTTKLQLQEVLMLSGLEQSRIWISQTIEEI